MTTAETPSKDTLTVDQAFQQAVTHHQSGNLQYAEHLYRAILKVVPQHPDSNHNLGVLAAQAQQPSEALPYFKLALESNPDNGQYWLNYINALIQTGYMDVARQALEQAIQRGLEGEGVDAIKKRLAIQLFTVTSTQVPAEPAPKEMEQLVTLFNQCRYAEAETLALGMTKRYPDHGFGWKALGAVLNLQGKTPESLIPLQKAAVLLPLEAEVHNNLGNSLAGLGRLEEAETSCRKALEIKPDYAEAHFNMGNALTGQSRLKEAEASHRKAIELKPDYAEAHINLGNALAELGRMEEAEARYRTALKLKPDYAEAHFNLGLLLLKLGRYKEAWPEYEFRCDPEITAVKTKRPDLPFPQWNGEPLAGKSLALVPEQGFGDYIQFVRYARLLKEQGLCRLTLICPPPLVPLLRCMDEADEVISNTVSVPTHDYWVFPLSLPLHFATSLETIPSALPYLSASQSPVSYTHLTLPTKRIV